MSAEELTMYGPSVRPGLSPEPKRGPPKVYSADGARSAFSQPVRGFPFSLIDHVVVDTAEEADYIYLWFPHLSTHAVNAHAKGHMNTPCYQRFKDKYVTWALCDFPEYSLTFGGTKFLLSPMAGTPKEQNCHAMPVHPVIDDYRIAMDVGYTAHCRALEKRHEFCFLGQLDDFPYKKYGGREWMKDVQKVVGKDHFFLRSRHKNAVSDQGWGEAHREWMLRVAEAKYGFCPIGGGDATMDPRLYWTMQVGTIPIITDNEFLAFEDQVAWHNLAVFVPGDQKTTFDYMSLPMEGPEYEEKRKAVIDFWDAWAWYPNCARRLVECYL